MTKKILAAVLCVLVMAGMSWADMFYYNGSNLVRVGTNGTETVTGLSYERALGFYHDDKAMMLVCDNSTGNIAVYSLDDLTAPVAEGNISSASQGFEVYSVAELGDNIVLAGYGKGGVLLEVNPETCAVVDTYTHYSGSSNNYDSAVYAWNNLLIASFATGYHHEEEFEADEVTIMMDTFGHITGQAGDFYIEDSGWFEASGGELYIPIGSSRPSELSSTQGLYCVTEMFSNGKLDSNDYDINSNIL